MLYVKKGSQRILGAVPLKLVWFLTSEPTEDTFHPSNQCLAADTRSGIMLWSKPLQTQVILVMSAPLPFHPLFLMEYLSLNYLTTQRHKV